MADCASRADTRQVGQKSKTTEKIYRRYDVGFELARWYPDINCVVVIRAWLQSSVKDRKSVIFDTADTVADVALSKAL